jgi:hypothetical protein
MNKTKSKELITQQAMTHHDQTAGNYNTNNLHVSAKNGKTNGIHSQSRTKPTNANAMNKEQPKKQNESN